MYADQGENNASGEASEKQYYVTDPHGNVVQLTDENRKVIKTYEYDSFGNEVDPDSKDDNSFRYCGEYYDKETGEMHPGHGYTDREKRISTVTQMPSVYAVQNLCDWVLDDFPKARKLTNRKGKLKRGK